MIGYKDRTYCGSDVKVHTCGRDFTEQDAIDAEEWWGGKDYPVAYMNFCDETDNTQPDHIVDMHEMVTDTNQASEDELQPFTSLFQNAAVARDYVPGCISEEDINELAAHIFFIEPTYKYDISKEPIDNVFSAYRIAVEALIRTEKLKLLAEVREQIKAGGYEASYEISVVDKLEAEL